MKKLLIAAISIISLSGMASADVSGPTGRFLQIRSDLQPSSTVHFSSGTVATSLRLSYGTPGECLQLDSTGKIVSAGAACGSGGGGGASSLEVFNNFDATRTSPTASISLSDAFRGSVSGSTYTFRINFSSVASVASLSNYLLATSSGEFIQNRAILQVGATAYPAFLQVGSSATVYGSIKAQGLIYGKRSQDELLRLSRDDGAGPNKNALIGFYNDTGSGDTLQRSIGYYNTNGSGVGITNDTGVNQWRLVQEFFPDKVRMRIYNPDGSFYHSWASSDTMTSNIDFTVPPSTTSASVGRILKITNVTGSQVFLDFADDNSGGGGGASALEVFNNFDSSRSSPTLSITGNNAFRGSVSGSTYTFALNSSSVTLYGPNIPAASISAGSLGSNVLASSYTASGVTAGSYTNTNLTVDAQGRITTASNGSAGSGGYALEPATVTIQAIGSGIKTSTLTISGLGAGVLHTVSGSSNVTTALVSLSTEVTGTLDISANTNLAVTPPVILTNDTLSVDSSSVTLQGNTFNTGTNLVKLSGGLIPNALIDGSSITKQGLLIAGNNIAFTPGAGTLTIESTSGGGGSGSPLEVFNNFDFSRSSPTLSITASNAFRGSVVGSTYTFALNSSSVTLYGPNIPASSIASGSLGSGVIASSIAVNSIGSNQISANAVDISADTNLTASNGITLTNDDLSVNWSSAVSRSDVAALYQPLDATLTDLAAAPLGELDSVSVGAIAAGILPSDVQASSVTAATITAGNMANGDHGDFTYSGGVAAIDTDAVALGTDSTGIYVASVTAGASMLITGTNNAESAAPIFNVNPSSVTTLGPTIEVVEISDIAANYQPLDATLTDLAAAPLGEDNSVSVGAIASGTLPTDVMTSSITLSAFFSDNSVRSNLGLAIGTNVQAYDADLDDLADGSLTGSKVGSGVPAANIAAGSLGASVLASSYTATGVVAGSYTLSSITVDAQGRISSASNGSSGTGDVILASSQTHSGWKNFTSPAGSTFTYGVVAGSFTSTGSGAGKLTLKDTDSSNFISFESSGALTYNQSYVLPDSTGTVDQVLAIRALSDGKFGTYWKTDETGGVGGGGYAVQPATVTFQLDKGFTASTGTITSTLTASGYTSFTSSVNFSNVQSTIFHNVSSVTYSSGTVLSLVAGSTFSITGSMSANNSYGDSGQVLQSNGPGASPSWVTPTGGPGGASALEVFNNFDSSRSSPTASISASDAFRGTVSGSTYTFQINFSSVASVASLAGYIKNQNTLQSGATAFPDFIQVGSSVTVAGEVRTSGNINIDKDAPALNMKDSGAPGWSGVRFLDSNDVVKGALSAGSTAVGISVSSGNNLTALSRYTINNSGEHIFQKPDDSSPILTLDPVRISSFTGAVNFASSMTLSGGYLVQNITPISGQVLEFNGTNWVPGTDDVGAGGGGYAVEPATVTFQLNLGVRASTGVFTSTITASTITYTGRIIANNVALSRSPQIYASADDVLQINYNTENQMMLLNPGSAGSTLNSRLTLQETAVAAPMMVYENQSTLSPGATNFTGTALLNSFGGVNSVPTAYYGMRNYGISPSSAEFVVGRADGIALNSTTDYFSINISSVGGNAGLVRIASLNCTANTNGGAITADANGNLTCSDDNSGGGGGDAVLAATQTFSGFNTFQGSTTFSGATSTVTFENKSATFQGVSSMTFTSGATLSMLDGSMLVIPAGTNPSIDITGKMAVDTTTGQLLIHDGSNIAVFSATSSKSMTIDTPTVGDFPFFWRPMSDITVTSLVCVSSAATSATVSIQECDANGATCTAINTAAACTTTNTPLAITDTAVAAGNRLRIQVTAVSGTPGWTAVDMYYRETRK